MDKTALEFPAPLKRWEMNYNELCDFCVNYHVKVNTLLFNIYYCHVSIFITYVNSARRPKLPCYTYLASMEPPDPPVAGAAAGDFPLTWHRRGCNMMQWLQNPKPCLPWTLSSRNLLPKWSGMTSKTIKTQGRFTSSGSSRPFPALEVQAQFDRILWLSRYVTVCHGMSWYVMVFSLSFNSFHPRKRQLVNHPRLSWSRSTRPIWTTNRAHLALAHVWQTRTSCHANGTKAARSLCLRWCDLILRNMWDNLIRRSWMGSRWRARWAAIWLQSSYYNILYKAQAWFVSTSCSINVLNVQTNRR